MLWHLVLAGLVGASLGGAGAWKATTWHHGYVAAERMEDEAEMARHKARAATAAATAYEIKRAAVQASSRVINREVERVVKSPVYLNVCLDDAGMHVLARALAGDPDAGQPAPALPASSGTR